jgi:hypothetical protein
MKHHLVVWFMLLFSSSLVAQFDYMPLAYDFDVLYTGQLYQKQTDLHTSVRPLRRTEVYRITHVDSSLQSLRYKGKFWNTWVGRALFSDHFIQVRTADFDLSIDPLVDFRYGRERSTDEYKYHNTRGVYIQGRIGKQVTFMSSFTDNQARYPDYVNGFISTTGVVPGQGEATVFNNTAWDFRNAFGVVSYTPSKYFNFSLGQGRVFFGEGHRSAFLGDGTFNYPYFRIETTVWKIKYINLWTQMLDNRKEVEINNESKRKKWVSAHYLSYNVNSRLNLSLFEAVVYGSDTNNRGLEASYFNPVILFRPIESANGSDAANVILGFGASYKLFDGVMVYGQLSFDEIVFGELFEANGSWRNKYAYQLGVKLRNAFAVENLHFRFEYNAARPYTFQHMSGRVLSNYGHFQQPIAHPWGANFNEFVFQAHYRYKRIVADIQLNMGRTGLDTGTSNWGKDIYKPYATRERDTGNKIAQGVTNRIMYVEARLGYLLNPSYNLRFEGGIVLRNQTFEDPSFSNQDYNGTYVYVGMRTGLFNNYYDF